MKYTKITTLSMLIFSIFFILSCKKDNSTSKRDMILGNWHYSSYAYDLNKNNVLDDSEIVQGYSSSRQPSILYLKADNSYSFTYQDYTYNPSTSTGTWELINSDSTLKMTTTTGSISAFTIYRVTSTTIVFNSIWGGTRWDIYTKL